MTREETYENEEDEAVSHGKISSPKLWAITIPVVLAELAGKQECITTRQNLPGLQIVIITCLKQELASDQVS